MFCRELLDLFASIQLSVAAGHNGLENLIRWAHIVEAPEHAAWFSGGELAFSTTATMDFEKDIMSLITALARKQAAGLVIKFDPDRQTIPDKVKKTAASLSLPVFTLPSSVKLFEVSSELCRQILIRQIRTDTDQSLLHTLLDGTWDDVDALRSRLEKVGLEPANGIQAAVLKLVDPGAQPLQSRGPDPKDKIFLFAAEIIDTAAKKGRKILAAEWQNDLVILDTQPASNRESELRQLLDDLLVAVRQKFPGIVIHAGLGRRYPEPCSIKKSWKEAVLSIALGGSPEQHSHSYRQLGVYRLLLNVENDWELDSFLQDTVGALDAYDRQNGSELVSTALAFLEENGNLVQAAKQLFIHRNTLKYRLQRIEEISDLNLMLAEHRLNFQIGWKVRRMLQADLPAEVRRFHGTKLIECGH